MSDALKKRLWKGVADPDQQQDAADLIEWLEEELGVTRTDRHGDAEYIGRLQERIETLEAQLAQARKGHEKEVYVWSENYASMERRLVAAEQAAATARADADRYRYVLEGVRNAIKTGRNEPLIIWREQIDIALSDHPAPAPTPEALSLSDIRGAVAAIIKTAGEKKDG
jgi:septal ring factor EnvC (AmiA/AmiB activator)